MCGQSRRSVNVSCILTCLSDLPGTHLHSSTELPSEWVFKNPHLLFSFQGQSSVCVMRSSLLSTCRIAVARGHPATESKSQGWDSNLALTDFKDPNSSNLCFPETPHCSGLQHTGLFHTSVLWHMLFQLPGVFFHFFLTHLINSYSSFETQPKCHYL